MDPNLAIRNREAAEGDGGETGPAGDARSVWVLTTRIEHRS